MRPRSILSYSQFRTFAPIEGVTGDHTIDGLLLLDRRPTIPWGTAPWPKVGDATQVALDTQLSSLADTVDAMSDLMLAESVHQLVGGNALRAGATVDAIGRGDTPPPVLDITRTPRRGGTVTHRLFVMLGARSAERMDDDPANPGRASIGRARGGHPRPAARGCWRAPIFWGRRGRSWRRSP